PRDGVAKLGVRELADGVGDWAVVHERALLAAAAIDVQIERVVAGVEHAAREPAIEGWAPIVEHAIPAAIPVQLLGRGGPEAGGIRQRAAVGLVVYGPHLFFPICRRSAFAGLRRSTVGESTAGETESRRSLGANQRPPRSAAWPMHPSRNLRRNSPWLTTTI